MDAEKIPLILVVEDEPLIRAYAAEMLQDAGWRALEASDSTDALKLLGAHPEVDVVFTDVTMPGEMDGLALAECVHRLHPQVELVVTSGRHVIANDNLPDDGTFLRKPYGFDDLIEVIASKLRASS